MRRGGGGAAPANRLRVVVAIGLALAGLGFVLAGLAPGSGPRLVPGGGGADTAYGPPIVAGLVVLVVAGVVSVLRRLRWTVAGGVVALVLLIGSATAGAAGIAYRLSVPAETLPFAGDLAQLVGEAVAAVATAVACVRRLRADG